MTQNINVEAREKLRHSYKEQYRFQAKSLRDLKKKKKKSLRNNEAKYLYV